MKISNGFIKNAFKIKEKNTGRVLDCFIQEYAPDWVRFNIGINGWNEWSFLYYLSEEEFNNSFDIV